MTDNNILFALPEIQTVLTGINYAGNALKIDNKEISGFSGKSEVIDKYSELYKMLCEAIEEYCELVKHDVERIKSVCDLMLVADQLAASSVHDGVFLSGGAQNGLPD